MQVHMHAGIEAITPHAPRMHLPLASPRPTQTLRHAAPAARSCVNATAVPAAAAPPAHPRPCPDRLLAAVRTPPDGRHAGRPACGIPAAA
eukprot:364942-Chlamydomonas_euryale.AAC.6